MSEEGKPAVDSPLPDSRAEARDVRAWFSALYLELRRRARGELFRHSALTMSATTLLHETWLHMDGRPLEFATQAELVSYAGRVMRGIVIDSIRAKRAGRHGGDFEFVPYETQHDLRSVDEGQVLQLDDGLRDLLLVDARLAELVELRFFAGLTFVEIAALRGQSVRTVQRDWDKARMLLFNSMST